MSEIQYETWETTTAGGVWILTVDGRGVEKPRRIKGPAGYRVRIPVRDREATSAKFYEAADDVFRNGTLVRVNATPEEIQEQIPDYDVEQALRDPDLLALLEKSGNSFQSAVKKLNERNVRRLVALGEENPDKISSAQEAFLSKWVMDNYRPGGAPRDEED